MSNQSELRKNMNREAFLSEVEKLRERVKADLGRLHGEPPCMYAIDIETLKSWPEVKREEVLATLRAAFSSAETIMQVAQNEYSLLLERSDATLAERTLSPVIYFKSIREDLETYEDLLHFVRSCEQKREPILE